MDGWKKLTLKKKRVDEEKRRKKVDDYVKTGSSSGKKTDCRKKPALGSKIDNNADRIKEENSFILKESQGSEIDEEKKNCERFTLFKVFYKFV